MNGSERLGFRMPTCGIPCGKWWKNVFEVDVFYGDNEGLIVAELELASESEKFEKPDWLGEEVTGDDRYYNAQIALKPYKEWVK